MELGSHCSCGVVSASHGPSGYSPLGPLYMALRWLLIASFDQVKQPDRFWPRSCLVNLKKLARKAALFLALAFRLLLWNSAVGRDKSGFLRIALRSARPACSISPAVLSCLFNSWSSSLRRWLFLALLFRAYCMPMVWAWVVMLIMVIVFSWLFTPLQTFSKTPHASSLLIWCFTFFNQWERFQRSISRQWLTSTNLCNFICI